MITRTRLQIELLPKPPPQNALNEVAKLIKDFDADMRRHIEGVPYKEGVIQQIRIPHEKFCRAIHATAPDFRPFDRPTHPELEIKELPKPEFLQIEEEVSRPESLASENGHEELQDMNLVIYIDEVDRRMKEQVYLFRLMSSEVDRQIQIHLPRASRTLPVRRRARIHQGYFDEMG